MGFKLGGFVCDKCVIFKRFTTSNFYGSEKGYELPKGWNVISSQRLVENYVISNESELVIYCEKCSRALKINKIHHRPTLQNER